ncbi:AbiH family protein [Jiangella alkaliphila]|uniref:Bacteriophage abortive infection AbiH n=1 Tax=Jiangella alkaliphila TaxID=419479 RepID=A0A1H2KJM2_9ACTN|nr:AbiH family protein [Jiangella alkaliphila]SDU68782.1 Bacteriophage abortive infection AbiH [Jiangella alkaliphila]
MGFRQFTTSEYEMLAAQHNIMALVGNGFDIQVTRQHRTRFSPRYAAFFHYLRAREFDSTNLIVQQMATLKEQGRSNWSDVEQAIEMLISGSGTSADPEDIYKATVAIQATFSEYLELVAPPDLLAAVGRDSSSQALAITSMSKFIGDVARSSTFEGFTFPKETNHYHLFNFFFVNFNYTPLLDDYIYRDQEQWQPRQHKWADRNFTFYPNPSDHPSGHGNKDTGWSTYLRTEVVHPHGQQAIPRSLLFGIDAPDNFNPGIHPHRKLMKPYWAMNSIEYGHLFSDVRLFIIFGCSLGITDGWWWRRIVLGLGDRLASELVIYWWSSGHATTSSVDIVEKFFRGAGVDVDDPIRQRIQDRIHVVVYTDHEPPTWLAT